ncbi:pilin [Patescibacteria group bacterium]|nr:pilin [Patescibacteria group bacterium]
MKKRLVIIFLTVFAALLVSIPITPALADCETGNLLPACTCSGQCQLTDFLALGSNIMQYGVGILAAVAIGFFINAGYTLLMAMGNPEKVEAGKKQLGGTFKGVAMVMLAWILVSTIIFFTTGNSSGLLFGRGEKWWKFEETELYEMYPPKEEGHFCPIRTFAAPPNASCNIYYTLQECKDTNEYGGGDFGAIAAAKQEHNCRSLGVCDGGPEKLCCDKPNWPPKCVPGS